ncbi:MAG: ring-cleaving dioxygenase [Caldilineales bacterium]
MKLQLTGIHHLTAVTAQVRRNLQFYTDTLGMRLVKRSVNQDDVSAYHLFYADGLASPGSDLTFFDWPHVPQEGRGRQSITRTGLRVDSRASLAWWADRLDTHGVVTAGIGERDGRAVLDFEDFEGQRLTLVAEAPRAETHPWERSPVPAEHQIRGLGPVTMTVARLEPTERVLTQVMGMRKLRVYPNPEAPECAIHVFAMGEGGATAELHVAERPDLPFVQPGAGGVHHVAFRVSTREEHVEWERFLSSRGVRNSGIIDRYYFRSIYFREPNGVLFELATDGPGFDVDEPMATLGERLALPPFLEPHRTEIEAQLKPLN